MPDFQNRATVSASQVPALFGVSPYTTRWMLYQWFKHPDWPEKDLDERMEAGVYLEPAILRWTADRMRLDVTPNAEQQYVVNEAMQLGTTLDATIVDPQRGPGVVEAKNVDWQVWKQDWTELAAPKHIELQVQAELAATGYDWAILACLVGGNELRLYERTPIPAVQEQIKAEVATFLEQVRNGPAPKATGSHLEIPGLNHLYPEVDPEEVRESDDQDLYFIWQQWEKAKAERLHWDKAAKGLQAQLLDAAGTAGVVQAPGVTLRLKKTRIAESVQKREAHIRTMIKGQDRMLGGDGDPDYSQLLDRMNELYGVRDGK